MLLRRFVFSRALDMTSLGSTVPLILVVERITGIFTALATEKNVDRACVEYKSVCV